LRGLGRGRAEEDCAGCTGAVVVWLGGGAGKVAWRGQVGCV
jgi:hypothetical protein